MISTIENPQKTLSSTRHDILEQLDGITDLPTLPTVFLNIMRLMRDPNIPLKEIARIVESDPAISMKILKLINSSFYGLLRNVESVQHAIVLLGNKTLKNIVISVSIFKALGGAGSDSKFNREAFWQHSIGCGLIARFLGNRLSFDRNEEAFIAGVIHDIGKVVLDKYFEQDLLAVMERIKSKNIPFYRAERELLGITHCEIGAYIAKNWNLPEAFSAVIEHHHDLQPEGDHAKLVALVQMADIISKKYRIGSSGDDFIPEIHPQVAQMLGLNNAQLTAWDEDIQKEIKKSQELQDLMLR